MHVTVGGPDRSSAWATVLTNPTARAKLVQEIVALVVAEELDGVDLAWWDRSAPVEPGAEYVYGELVSDLRAAAKQDTNFTRAHGGRRLRVTVMARPREFHSNAFREADFIHLMSFDNCTAEQFAATPEKVRPRPPPRAVVLWAGRLSRN